MSWFEPTDVSCPRCSEAFTAPSADSINAARTPEMHHEILAGRFHVVTCPACSQTITIDRRFMYTDFARGHFVYVFRRAEAGDWQRCEQIAGETYQFGFEGAPPAVQVVSRQIAVRAVFGVAALAEKLRIWDARLDDRLVELMKLELVTAQPELARERNLEVLVTSASNADGQLEFLVRQADAGPDDEVTVYGASRARYHELELQRDYLTEQWPGLFHLPYVSYRRLAREPAIPIDDAEPEP